MNKKLFLLDGMALIYRAYFAFIKNPRITSKGDDVSAIFGFLNTIQEIIKKHQPEYIAVALDVSGPTFRHDLFPDYKANRDEPPHAIRYSIPIIKEILNALNISIIEKQGYEADDIIGTISKIAEKNHFTTYMVTPDKDYAQLVDHKTYMLKPARGSKEEELLDRESILDQWKIKNINQVIDILGLSGDSVDNIPGVPGIGPKTAQKLIEKYESIENIYKNTNELKGKQKENIEKYKNEALLSKRLVTIDCHVPLDIKFEDFILREPNYDDLRSLLAKLEFKTMIKRIFNNSDNQIIHKTENSEEKISYNYENIKTVAHSYKILNTLKEQNDFFDKLNTYKEFAFDIETNSLDVKTAEILGIAFSYKANSAYYMPILDFKNIDNEILSKIKLIFSNPNSNKIGQNIKFDCSVLLWNGIDVKGKLIDTMIAHYLIDPDQRHNLDYISKTELNYEPIALTSIIGEKKSNQISMKNIELKILSEYASEDADITLQIWKILKNKLKEKGLEQVFFEIEMPLLTVLARMEYRGIKINTKSLKIYSNELTEKINSIEKNIYTFSGMPFNINSPKQLGEVLFDILKIIEKPKKTKTGQYQTNEEVLMELKDRHKIVRSVIEFRQLTKLKSTYVDALPDSLCKKTNRIHTTFSQSITTTGRLSSSNPNLQNIPIKTDEGRRIRESFIPEKDYLLLACDYSQIELRIMAELSGDKNLREAFLLAEDIHTATASKIFKVSIDKVTREMRSKAKMVNFGIIYGISAFGLSKRLGISRNEASSIIEEYKMSYPGVQNYLDETIHFAEKNEYVETITGRRRYIRDINAKNKMVKSGAERNAINAPIQGTAADMIKIAMINIERELEYKKYKTKLLLQVHDELVFDLFPSEKNEIIPIIEKFMTSAIQMNTPIIISSGVGNNWLEAH